LSILLNGEDEAQLVYMGSFYFMYFQGSSLDSILRTILQIYFTRREGFDGIEQKIKNFENIKENIILQVVNREKNADLLSYTPHKDLENTDISVVYKMHLQLSDNQIIMKGINDNCFAHWGISSEVLFYTALENTVRLFPAKIDSMDAILASSFNSEEPYQTSIETLKMEDEELYVLSNSSHFHGASVILYPEILQKLADNACAKRKLPTNK